jgi:hypothetical protein
MGQFTLGTPKMVTNSFENQKYMQSMGGWNMHSRCLEFFPLKFWVGGMGGGFFSFFVCSQHVPFSFPSSPQWVPKMLPKFPMLFAKGVPNSTLLQSHMFYPKSSPSHLYRWAQGEGTPSFNRIFYFWGAFIVSTFFCDWPLGQSKSLLKKKLDLWGTPN